jgi:hydroxymethylbilane synthase
MPYPLRLGTRSSPLARWQADWVAARLRDEGVNVEMVLITTHGDQSQSFSSTFVGQGVFTKEIQVALRTGQIDLAVHSLKDLPTEPIEGLHLAAVPARGPTQDVLVSRSGASFEQLPPGAAVGTGSVRRRAQLWHVRPDLAMQDIRGNVDTRLRKLDEGQYDAIVLAEAGLRRLGLEERITEVLPDSLLLPAVGQGALGLETRTDDSVTRQAVAPLNDSSTLAAVTAERALLAALRGGCLAPVGALAVARGERLEISAVVLSADGRQRLSVTQEGPIDAPSELGRVAAEKLLQQGAAELIQAARR